MLILCSPHNPIDRVWRKEELCKIHEICLRNKILVLSDEIHSDIVYSGFKHTPFPSIAQEVAENTIYCIAPGKTFNIAGLKLSIVHIENDEKRRQFIETCLAMSLDIKNTFGIEAFTAAYTKEAENWLAELLCYLEENRNFLSSSLNAIDGVQMTMAEGTFLAWVDFTKTGFSDKDLMSKIIIEKGVVCVPGTWFGEGGSGHLRLNIGCPKKTIESALERIKSVL